MVETTEAKQLCRAATTLLYPELDFDIKPCGTYAREDFEQVLSRIAFDGEFANTGGKAVQLDRGGPVEIDPASRNPIAKSLLYHLRQRDADAIDDQFDGVRDRLFQILRERRLLPSTVDVAIDLHEWRFYGNKDTDRVLVTYPDQGTNRAYVFATLCIVTPNVRFTLDVISMEANDFDAKREVVRNLIEVAREYVTIRHVYLDRGFYQVHVVAELLRLDVDFIVRARPSKGMKDRLPAERETVVDSYRMQRKRPPTATADVTVFAVPHRTNDDEHVWFVTNLEIEDEAARAYAAAFRRRWGIETSYRQIGDFLPRTSSPTFSVRLFYFLFAVSLYNLWVFANVVATGGAVPDPPPISTKVFRLFVWPLDYG